MKRMLRVTLAVAWAGALMSPVSARAADLGAGDVAPGFSLPGSDGQTHSLADYAGKQVVVLAWYPKAFTGGCTIECKSLRDSSDTLRSLDVAFFAASVDDAETNKKFAESLELDYPILSDPDKTVADAYGTLHPEWGVAQRFTFYIGKDGKILFVDREVKPQTAGADMAAKLKELGIESALSEAGS